MLDLVKLGNNGPLISRIGLGCMSMSANYEAEHKDEESILTIQKAYEAGINFFDTADMYGKGHNELLLNSALKEILKANRKSVVLASKCGFVFKSDAEFGVIIDLSPEHIISACEGSLERLGVDYIDVFYLHRLPKGGLTALRESLDALIALLEAEKIKHIGLSEADAESILFTHDYLNDRGFPDSFVAVQSEFSLLVQCPLIDGVLSTCEKLNLSFIPYSPLTRGLLTEKMHEEFKFSEEDFRQHLPLFQGENFKHNLKIRDKLKDLAEKKGCTITQLALAWLMSHYKKIVPIPGTRYIDNLKNNLGALSIKLTEDELKEIKSIAKVKGIRYPEKMFAPQNIKIGEFELELLASK